MDSTSNSTRFLLTIVVPLVISAVVVALSVHRLMQPTQLDRAMDVVGGLLAPGDLVLLYPESRFPDLEQVDDQMDAIAVSSLPPEVDRFARVILVRPRQEQAPTIRRALAGRAALLYAEDVADLTVELFQVSAPDRVVLDLTDALRTANVTVFPEDEEPVDCPWSADRFDCADSDWTWVGKTTQVFDGEPLQCVWMHPIDDADLVVEFPVVSGTHVAGWYGLTDYALSVADGGAVRLKIEAGDEASRFRAHRQSGRRPLRFELPEDYSGPLQITVSATRTGVRHFCWNLQVVNAGSP